MIDVSMRASPFHLCGAVAVQCSAVQCSAMRFSAQYKSEIDRIRMDGWMDGCMDGSVSSQPDDYNSDCCCFLYRCRVLTGVD